MTQDQIVVLLGSTVVAAILSAIISAIVSVRNNNRNAKYEYITKERSQWRKEIREIAVELEKAKNPYDKKNKNAAYVREVLAKLKVRINANGMYEDATNKQDRHIWERIHTIDNYCGRVTDDVEDWDRLEEELEYLIRDLSLLLKDDWERCKKEVDGIGYIFRNLFNHKFLKKK